VVSDDMQKAVKVQILQLVTYQTTRSFIKLNLIG